MSATPGTRTGTDESAVSFSVDLVTDPVGADLTATVDSRLPAPAAEALVRDVEAQVVGQERNLVFQSIRVSHGTLRSYAQRNGYEMEPIIQSVEILDADVRGREFHARWGWPIEIAPYFNFGVSPHTISGNPLLHFFWEEVGQWVQTESVEWGSRTGGIPESRYVQAGINWLRDELA